MNVNSKNYPGAKERRDEIEELLNKTYEIAFHLQDMYNQLDDDIYKYEQSEKGLDD